MKSYFSILISVNHDFSAAKHDFLKVTQIEPEELVPADADSVHIYKPTRSLVPRLFLVFVLSSEKQNHLTSTVPKR